MRLRLLRYLDRMTDRRPVIRPTRPNRRLRIGVIWLALLLTVVFWACLVLFATSLMAQVRGSDAVTERSEADTRVSSFAHDLIVPARGLAMMAPEKMTPVSP